MSHLNKQWPHQQLASGHLQNFASSQIQAIYFQWDFSMVDSKGITYAQKISPHQQKLNHESTFRVSGPMAELNAVTLLGAGL